MVATKQQSHNNGLNIFAWLVIFKSLLVLDLNIYTPTSAKAITDHIAKDFITWCQNLIHETYSILVQRKCRKSERLGNAILLTRTYRTYKKYSVIHKQKSYHRWLVYKGRVCTVWRTLLIQQATASIFQESGGLRILHLCIANNDGILAIICSFLI